MLGRIKSGVAVSLVPRLPDDIAVIYDWFDDPDFQSGRELRTYEQFLKRFEDQADDDDCTVWSVVRGAVASGPPRRLDADAGREIIGMASLSDFGGGSCLESSLYLIPSEQGKGYGTEAVRLRAAYAFDFLDQEVLRTTTDQENGAARRVLEKAGYQRTGWQPHYTRRGGRWRDLDVYALTREWWEAARARY